MECLVYFVGVPEIKVCCPKVTCKAHWSDWNTFTRNTSVILGYRSTVPPTSRRFEESVMDLELRVEFQTKQAKMELRRLQNQGDIAALQAELNIYKEDPTQGNTSLLNVDNPPMQNINPLIPTRIDHTRGGSSTRGLPPEQNVRQIDRILQAARLYTPLLM